MNMVASNTNGILLARKKRRMNIGYQRDSRSLYSKFYTKNHFILGRLGGGF